MPNRRHQDERSSRDEGGARDNGGSARFTLDRVIRLVLGGGAFVLAVWTIWYFSSLIIYLVVGMVLAYLMGPIMDRMQGLGLGRISSILVTFVLVFGLISILLTKLVPFAGSQIKEISQQIAFETAARVVAVEDGGPAAAATVHERDLLVSVEGQRWGGYDQLRSVLRAKQPGDTLGVTVEDVDQQLRSLVLVVGPKEPEQPVVEAPDEADGDEVYRVGSLGMQIREVPLSNVATAIENRLRNFVPVEKGAIVQAITSALGKLFQEDRITQLFGSVFGIFTDIFYAVLVVPFVAFFFLKDGTRIRHSLLRMVPNRYFEVTLAIVQKIESTIGRYFRALLLQSMSVATVASILLYVVGLKYALAVGVFTGLANTIPYFGPFMGFLAGTLVGIVQTGDFSLVPGVLIAMALTQASDNVVFQPFIFSRAAQAHPLVILFVVLIGAQLAGIIGMLIAIPLATIVRITVQQVLWSLRNYRIMKHA